MDQRPFGLGIYIKANSLCPCYNYYISLLRNLQDYSSDRIIINKYIYGYLTILMNILMSYYANFFILLLQNCDCHLPLEVLQTLCHSYMLSISFIASTYYVDTLLMIYLVLIHLVLMRLLRLVVDSS